ncbi:hypothetical protein [Caulobacter sp. Root1472]|uniref:hypothetical protein n=1 Tax=Caulobacter sp. Root1472 TaxID=1736470 RepID=UPI000A7A0695|nr:hypothetical protein [Caulobacter sp. Root1472]
MVTKNAQAAAFPDALGKGDPEPPPPPPAAARSASRLSDRSREARKHIGGYFEQEMVEKFAVLKARLGMDNSELIKKAIDALYASESARRAFGERPDGRR